MATAAQLPPGPLAPVRGRRPLIGLLVGAWAAFVASVYGRAVPGEFDPWLDVGVYNLSFGFAALASLARARAGGPDAGGWRMLGLGLFAFLGGNVYGSLVIGDQEIYPSLADGLWFSFYVFVYVAVVRFVRARVVRFHASTWLDGAVGGLGLAALTVAFALGPVLEDTSGSVAVVVTNMAFPLASVVLIALMTTAGHALGARDRGWWLLTLGLGVFTVADVVFLYQKASDSYQEGGPLDVMWPGGAVIMGLAALSGRRADGPGKVLRDYSFPAAFGFASVGLLLYGQGRSLPPVAIALAVGALAVAALRTVLTVREVHTLARSRQEARTDDLTGLPNRRMVLETLSAELAAPQPRIALLILDLDRFKEVNDSLGHAAGDALLETIGARLARVLPEGGTFGRLGGDEFAVLLPGADVPEAERVARAIAEAMSASFTLAGVCLHASFSIGVAAAPRHGAEPDLLLARADIAMYRAKRLRTGVEAWHAAPDDPSRSRIEALGELRSAVEGGHLAVYYQPQVHLPSGRIVGVEALVRWPHPTRDVLPPAEFLAMAEQSGLMPAITRFVLDRALRDARVLRDAGHALRMSVNISASDLVNEALVEEVRDGLIRHGLSPSDLVVEVTEDSVMIERSRSIDLLRRLRESGVRVSIDDFGTGHASLAYVRDLPLDELKLDRAFLRGVPTDVHNATIVRSTIELAHSLSMPVVAEGVEDQPTVDWLRALGCDEVQGFHYSRPVPMDRLRQWLESRHAAVA